MKKLLLLFLSFFICISISSCNKENNSEKRKIIDVMNREIFLPENINNVVCVGSGVLRLYSYIGDTSLISGIEDCENINSPIYKRMAARPYSIFNSEKFKNLPSCGLGSGKHQFAEPEKILACKPDIVLTSYIDADNLQKQLGIPTVCLSYGVKDAFDKDLKKSINIIGEIFNKQERANAINNFITNIETELNNLTKNIEFKNKKSIYLGCLSKGGLHGIESSHADYSLFEVSHIRNILKENGLSGYQREVDLEKILAMDPDKIIIDAGGIGILKQQAQLENFKVVFKNLSAFKNDEVYIQLPYNSYSTNIEIALCNAYYEASIAYPDLFKDLNINKKCEEIFSFFFTKDLYYQTLDMIGYQYGKLNTKELFI